MYRKLRNLCSLLVVGLGHFVFLTQGAMLGCGFQSQAANTVDDNMDAPNAYTCSCRCSANPTLNVRLSAALDDVEGPQASDPDGATDLDFGGASVGVRFTALALPQGAIIKAASIQFTADAAFGADNTTPLSLTIFAEAADNAPPFATNVVNNLGALPRTTLSLGWNVPPWSVSQSGPAQLTPDLSPVIQEVVNRAGWRSGNALLLIFAGGGGRREAEAFDGTPARAAMLSVQFEVAPVQALNVCMPDALNPNLKDANGNNHPTPQADQLQADCAGRVQKTFADLASACGYPSTCTCEATADPQRFNVACNNPCSQVSLDPACANFNPPAGTVGATNVQGDTPVCVVPLPPANSANALAPTVTALTDANAPSSITAAMYGQQSECHVDGPATVAIGDEHKTTAAQGTIGLIGKPCPQGQCAVGLTYGLTMAPVTFSSFFSSATFRDLASTGGSVPNAGLVDAAGVGTVGAQQTDTSVRGRRDSDTRAFVFTNPDALDMFAGWGDHVCGLSGNLAGSVDAEDKGDQDLTATVDLGGEIVNEPPHADAGQDQVVECTSAAGATLRLDARGSSDPEDNAVLFSWFRDGRAGQPIGFGETLELHQKLNGSTNYVLRVIDAFGQSDEDTTTVRVVDTTAPALSVSVSPTVLRPPNHGLVPVTVTLNASDACDPNPALRLVSITSNEGDRADGSGHTSPDIQGAQFGTDDRLFWLRAERRGGGTGRIYTITYESEDAHGNVAVRQATVAVPKS